MRKLDIVMKYDALNEVTVRIDGIYIKAIPTDILSHLCICKDMKYEIEHVNGQGAWAIVHNDIVVYFSNKKCEARNVEDATKWLSKIYQIMNKLTQKADNADYVIRSTI